MADTDVYKDYLQQQADYFTQQAAGIGNQITELTSQQTLLTSQAGAALDIIAFIDSGGEMPQLINPVSFSAEAGDELINITWNQDLYADNYVIHRAIVSNFAAFTVVYDDAWTATFTDVGLTNGTTYYYRIKAQAPGFSESGYSTDSALPNDGLP